MNWLRKTSGIPWKKRIRHHVNVVRWMLDRCAECGHRFAWKGDPRHGLNSETFHGPCVALKMWRTRAEERLEVLALVCDIWGVTASDVQELMANRQPDDRRSSDGWNRAWRVFRDMEQHALTPTIEEEA